MPKILVGECKQEVSSFNPVISTYADFDISVGKELLDFHQGVGSELAGALRVFAQAGDVEIVPPTAHGRSPRRGHWQQAALRGSSANF